MGWASGMESGTRRTQVNPPIDLVVQTDDTLVVIAGRPFTL